MVDSRLILLDQKVLPSDARGLELLDILLINGFSTESLTEDQRTAILQWVERGGTLLLGTGQEAEKVLGGFSEDLGLSLIHISLQKQEGQGKDPDAGDHIKDRGGSPHPEDLKGRGKASLGLFQIIDDHIHVGDQKDLHQTCHQGAVQAVSYTHLPSTGLQKRLLRHPPLL